MKARIATFLTFLKYLVQTANEDYSVKIGIINCQKKSLKKKRMEVWEISYQVCFTLPGTHGRPDSPRVTSHGPCLYVVIPSL